MNGSIFETPFIRCLYSFLPKLSTLPDEEELPEQAVIRAATEAELMLPDGCRLKAHTGPGRIKRQGKDDPEVKFILDFDLSRNGKLEAGQVVAVLDQLHDNANRAFQGAITIRLHEAMDPV